MRQLFFYGGATDHFITTAVPFVRAAGGAGALIALLAAPRLHHRMSLQRAGRLPQACGRDGAGCCARGIGIDDPICLSITDETEVRVDGVGRAYRLRRTGAGAIAVQVHEPGQTFSLLD